jgi:release factor glutamine methyltransferase
MRRKNWKILEYRYLETWTVKKILDWGIGYFGKKDIPQARLSAELLLASVLGLTRMELYLNHSRVLTPGELADYKGHIIRRLEHVPIQYILGQAHFRNISLCVDENVLIPRPETELVVEKALEEAKSILESKESINIVEIGTGSGAIAISLYAEFTEKIPRKKNDIRITATDISKKAIEVAKKNAENILPGGNTGGIDFICCDMLPEEDSVWFSENKGKIDLLISNPPYISQSGFDDLPREIKDYEPSQALLAGNTGLESYEEILSRVKDILSPDACIIFETDPVTWERLVSLVKEMIKPRNISMEKDYNQKERIVIAHLRG